jgi:hypothetical protein
MVEGDSGPHRSCRRDAHTQQTRDGREK